MRLETNLMLLVMQAQFWFRCVAARGAEVSISLNLMSCSVGFLSDELILRPFDNNLGRLNRVS